MQTKADWYDPTIAREDKFWGKQEHGKDQEDNEPQYKDTGIKVWV